MMLQLRQSHQQPSQVSVVRRWQLFSLLSVAIAVFAIFTASNTALQYSQQLEQTASCLSFISQSHSNSSSISSHSNSLFSSRFDEDGTRPAPTVTPTTLQPTVCQRGQCAAPDFNWHGRCGVAGYKCVVSFGMYGSQRMYTQGAIINSELVKTVFPGWITRFYHDASVPADVLQQLRDNGAEVVSMSDKTVGGISGMFWRFTVASDSSVQRYLVRDTDSQLNHREHAAVSEWMISGFSVHIMRDHPYHTSSMMGGMWGGVRGVVADISSMMSTATQSGYDNDQAFLRTTLYPRIQYDSLSHDAFSCHDYAPQSYSFPTQRNGTQFVGQQFDNDNHAVQLHIELLMGRESPVQCRRRPDYVMG